MHFCRGSHTANATRETELKPGVALLTVRPGPVSVAKGKLML